MSITVGKSVARVDALDKVTGRTKYYEDRLQILLSRLGGAGEV